MFGDRGLASTPAEQLWKDNGGLRARADAFDCESNRRWTDTFLAPPEQAPGQPGRSTERD